MHKMVMCRYRPITSISVEGKTGCAIHCLPMNNTVRSCKQITPLNGVETDGSEYEEKG